MNKKLENLVVVVTGASSGIGEATAYELGKHGAILVLTARREDRLKEVAKKIQGQANDVLAVKSDLTKPSDIDNLVDKTLKRFGRIDVLINNAGWGVYNWIEKLSYKDILGQFAVNVVAMAYLTGKVVPIMQKQRSGHIINMSSYASRIAIPPLNIYASTKYAVEGLSDALRRELAPWGVKVTRIHPSSVSGTEFNAKAKERGGVEYRSYPIGRITSEKLAREIVNLLLDPKPELFISRLYDVPVFFNRHYPGLVDFVMKMWVGIKRKTELRGRK